MSSKLQIRSFLLSGLVLISGLLFSQDSLVVVPDNHYNGGKESFVKYMKDNVPYPETAKTEGLIGLSIVTFKIDCENAPYDINFYTQLGYGIEKLIKKAIENSAGNWINCNEKERLIRLHIAFDINKYYSHEKEDFTIYAEGPYEVMTDESLAQFFNARLKKEKYKQAKYYLELLLLRYPYNEAYKTTLHKINAKIN